MWKTRKIKADPNNEPYGFAKDIRCKNGSDVVSVYYKNCVKGRRDKFFQCVATLMNGVWDYRIINYTTKKDITHKFEIKITQLVGVL